MKNASKLLMVPIVLFSFSCKDALQPSEGSTEANPLEKTEMEAPKSEYSPILISESRVGKFAIGDALPTNSETYQIEKRQQTRYTDDGSEEETVFVLSRNNSEKLLLKPKQNPSGDKIGEIFILSENFKTQEGIGVNSTIADFIKTYPNFKLWYTYVSDRYVLENSKSEIQFFLDEKGFTGKMEVNEVKVPLKPTDFREGARIVKIRIYK